MTAKRTNPPGDYTSMSNCTFIGTQETPARMDAVIALARAAEANAKAIEAIASKSGATVNGPMLQIGRSK